jgi:hypothetical protein
MPSKPTKSTKIKKKDNKRNTILIGAAIGLVLVFGLAIPLTAMQFENHNSFCASCHTEGEVTFFDRSTVALPVDLASIHDIKGQARCVDCHTGPGIIGRYGGLMAGASDLVSYYSGHYPQPAALEEPYPDANCMKCHGNIAANQDFSNHFHTLMFQWQSVDPAHAAHCVDCHASHDTTNDAGIVFIDKAATVKVCQKCHAAAGEG